MTLGQCVITQPQLFATLGSGDSALGSTLIVGIVNVAATVIAIVLVDRVGASCHCCSGRPAASCMRP